MGVRIVSGCDVAFRLDWARCLFPLLFLRASKVWNTDLKFANGILSGTYFRGLHYSGL